MNAKRAVAVMSVDHRRLSVTERNRNFVRLLRKHLVRYGPAWLLAVLCFGLFSANYRLVPNATRSLPQSWFLVHLNEEVSRGDYASFLAPDNGIYPAGLWWVKRVAGQPGDVLTRSGLDFAINGQTVATARLVGLSGRSLTPLSVPTDSDTLGAYRLRAGEYFVVGTHPFSYDSRYAPIGLIRREQLKGRAHALF